MRSGDQVAVVGADRIELTHETADPEGAALWLWRQVLRYVDGAAAGLLGHRVRTGRLLDDSPTTSSWCRTRRSTRATPSRCRCPAAGAPPAVGRCASGDRAERHGGAVALRRHLVLGAAPGWRRRTSGASSTRRPATQGRVVAAALLRGRRGRRPVAGAGRVLAAAGLRRGRLRAAGAARRAARLARAGRRGREPRARAPTAGRSRSPPTCGGHEGARRPARRRDPVPGLGRRLRRAVHHKWNSETITVTTEDGFTVGRYELTGRSDSLASKQRFARGTRLMPPYVFWNHLRPRDPAGSAALRALTDERAGALPGRSRRAGQGRGACPGRRGAARADRSGADRRRGRGRTAGRQAGRHSARLHGGPQWRDGLPQGQAEGDQAQAVDPSAYGGATDDVFVAALNGPHPVLLPARQQRHPAHRGGRGRAHRAGARPGRSAWAQGHRHRLVHLLKVLRRGDVPGGRAVYPGGAPRGVPGAARRSTAGPGSPLPGGRLRQVSTGGRPQAATLTAGEVAPGARGVGCW